MLLQSISISNPPTWAGGAIVLAFATWYLNSSTNAAKAKRAGAVLAPGPRRFPVVGNLLNFPKGRWYEAFTQWAQEYGDIIYVDVAGIPMIVLNSLDAIHELMDKRMNIHSGRPQSTLVSNMMSFGYFLAFMQPTKELTEQRRLFQKSIGPRGVEEYDSFLIHGSSELLQGLDGFSGQPMDVLVKTLGNALTRIAYGEHFFQHHGEEIIEKNVEALELLSWAVTKFWLVDLIPALRYIPAWFPGANFKHVGNKGKNCADTIRYWPIDRVNAASSKGISDNSILSKYRNEGGFSEESVRDAVAIMYIGGIDTTTATVTHFLFSITLYSNWQKLIQEEMDQVLGRGTIPTIEDIPKLKIFNAVFKESLRWIPAAPIGLPHVSSKEDVWNGYYIPRGSIVHCNIGFVLKDPRIWGKDSQEFNPNRFLPEHNPSVDELPDIWSIPFGFGRRICPGRHLAHRTVLFYSAIILSTYEILPYEGERLTSSPSFDDAAVRRLSNFRCTFKPRT